MLDETLLSDSWLHLTASCCSLTSSPSSFLAFTQLRSKMAWDVEYGGSSA